MTYRSLFLSVFCVILTLSVVISPVKAATLEHKDFQKEQFAKTVDYFDYARAWAALKGMPKPPNNWHANAYMTYVNHSGFQMIYAGLENISLQQNIELTIPMQTVLMHFKTQESNQDAIVASSFLMVMGFNDSMTSLNASIPDKNDNLWASFSLGINLTALFPDVTFPAFNSGAEPIGLLNRTKENGAYEWTWGMRYANLTALWVTLDLADESNTNPSRPYGLATYDELTFTYNLTLHDGVATLQKNYVMGRMHDLFVFGGWFLIWPIYNHYNATGCYRYNAKVSDQTIYEFLEEAKVSMSIVEYQKTILLDKETESTVNGEDVAQNEVDATDAAIETHSEDGELICIQNFTAKPTYRLNRTDQTSEEYKAYVCTHKIQGYARNRNLFQFQTSFERYIPLILVGMYPGMFARARDTIANITVADALYVVSYPSYGGYMIDHDPVLTAYYTPTQSLGPDLSQLGGALILAVIAIPIIVVIALKRKRQAPAQAFTLQ
jgi:hypothetical protein